MSDISVIRREWPYDGPYSHDSVADAAKAITELVEYLNNATSTPSTLAWAVTSYDVLLNVGRAVSRLDQLMGNLSKAMATQATDPTLYHDEAPQDRRLAVETARQVSAGLDHARLDIGALAAKLNDLPRLAWHLGNKD